MAARRLIILMVVLLVISTLAAALLPAPESDDEEPTRGETTPREGPRPGPPAAGSVETDGRVLRATVDTAPKPPQIVPTRAGDQLTLLVTSRFADLVELPAFGLIKAVAPGAPARFELLLERAGNFPIRTLEGGLLAGRVCVTAAELSPRARRARSRARACAPRGRRGREGESRSAPRP
jgi:hypothetical protein